MYLGTLAVHSYRRKQDTARKEMYARVGLAANAAWDVAQRMRRHAEKYELRVSPGCPVHQARESRSKVRVCSPFFFTGGGG